MQPQALLEAQSGSHATKEKGLEVKQATVTKSLSLIYKSTTEVDFQGIYGAGTITIQQGGKTTKVSNAVFSPVDLLVLQVWCQANQ